MAWSRQDCDRIRPVRRHYYGQHYQRSGDFKAENTGSRVGNATVRVVAEASPLAPKACAGGALVTGLGGAVCVCVCV